MVVGIEMQIKVSHVAFVSVLAILFRNIQHFFSFLKCSPILILMFIAVNTCRWSYRPHPNECSGGDLDGDLFFISWDKDLIPSQIDNPMDYTGRRPRIMDHKVTLEVIF